MNKKIKILIIVCLALILALAAVLLWPKNSNSNTRPEPSLQLTTQETTQAVKTTEKHGYIIVSDNEYGGKDYKFTVKSREVNQ